MGIKVFAPAKINLTLNITGKRKDGYHDLKSVMQSVSLGDIITLTPNESNTITISCSDENIPCGESNIAYKSAVAFFRYENIKQSGLHIHIIKNIPVEAGLGGGSADGAGVILGLNELYGRKLTIEKLCDIGTPVGADIPFCITGGTCLCEGIGDKLMMLNPLPDCFIVIGKGKKGCSTKEAYRKIDEYGFKASKYDFDVSVFSQSLQNISEICSNIFDEYSGTNETKDIKSIMLSRGALCSCLSGSGAAVFGIFTCYEDAVKCCGQLISSSYYAFVSIPERTGARILN